MSLTNFQNNRVVHRNDTSSIQLSNDNNTLTKATNDKLDQANTNLTSIHTQQDGVIGAINNNEIGDATLGNRTYVYAHDSANGKARALKCDTTGRLECSVDALEVTAETINLNTDTLETLITTTNTKLQSDLDFAGQPNAIGDGSNMKRVMNYGHDSSGGAQRPLKVNGSGELSVAVTSTALPTGAATESTLSSVKTSVELLDDVVTVQNAAHPSKANAVGGRYYVDNTFRDIRVDNIGKVIIDTPSGSDLHNAVDGTRKALFTNPAGSGLTVGENASAINTNIIAQNSKIDTTNSTLADAETHLGNIDGNITACNTGAVTISSALPTGSNTIGTVTIQDGGNSITIDGTITANAGTNLNTSALATQSTLADAETHLGNIDGNITACNTGAVTISSALPTGSNTIGKVNIGTFDNAITVNAGTNLNTSALATQSTLADAEAHLGNIETAVQLLDNIVSGNEAQCDIVASLPSGTNAIGKTGTNRSYGSEVSYVSSQSISGSGTHTGSAITLDANVRALYVEHDFSHTGIKYEILASIDNSTFLSTGVEFNAGGMSPATLTGLSTILGTSTGSEGFPPYIKFKFSNSDSSVQSATLSYVIQSN